MFEAAEVGRKLEKEKYKAQVPVLRAELLDVQQQLLQAPFPVIVLFAGVDAAGKSETASLLNEWMDPHWIVTRGYVDPSEEELERPRLWRYWRDLPPKGRIALFLSAWYSSPIRHRVARRISSAEFDALLDEVAAFERALTDDGAVILKFWMHLGKAAQKKRRSGSFSQALKRFFCAALPRCNQTFRMIAPSSVSARSNAATSSSSESNSAFEMRRATRCRIGDGYQALRNSAIRPCGGRSRQ